MKWTIQQLNVLKNKGIEFDQQLDLSDLKERDPQIRKVSPIQVKGTAVLSGDVVTFPLEIVGTLTLPCSRTLADVELPFDIHVSESFRLNQSYTDVDQDTEEIHSVERDQIDLIPYIKEQILLQIPMQIFSEDGEQGEAPLSGNDWGIVTEADQNNKVDPRLAELKKFFEK